MADSKYFGIPFATSGDKAAIPEATQPSGAISFTQGFGPDYERDPATDPLAKRVPRDETNELYFQVTNALKFLQLYGTPEWYAVDGAGNPVSYPLTARVRHDVGSGMQAWRSLVANNTAEPGTDLSKWALDTPFDISTAEASLAEALAGVSGSKIVTPRRLASATQRGAWNFAIAAGSAEAITASFSPQVALLSNGLNVKIRASAANTTTSPTFTPNPGTIAASPIRKGANLSLAPGDISGAGFWMDLTYDMSADAWILENPATGVTPQQMRAISASVSGNALTVGYLGGNLSFRSTSLANGSPTSVSVGASSLTVPSGASLGTVPGALSQIALLALFNGGSPVLALVHVTPSGGVNLDETALISSLAINSGSSSANTVYSAVPVSNSPFRVLGYVAITEATPGQWASPPSLVQPSSPMSPLSFLANSPGFSTNANSDGYQKLPSGIIFQWGMGSSTGSGQRNQSITLPLTFPTVGLQVFANDTGNGCLSFGASFTSRSTFNVNIPVASLGTSGSPTVTGNCQFRWYAIGF